MTQFSTVRLTAPSAANPNDPGVGIGDVFCDPAGAEPPATVQGPPGGQVLSPFAGPLRRFASLVITAAGAGVLTVTGQVVDGLGDGVQGVVMAYLDDSAGVGGAGVVLVLTLPLATGLQLAPTPIAVTRLAFEVLTDGTGNFSYAVTAAPLGAGPCTQVHTCLDAINAQAVAIV